MLRPVVTLDVSQNSLAHYQWSTGEKNPSIEITKTGNYSVIVSNVCGDFSDNIFIIYRLNDCRVYVPNAFSPNNDGINDVIHPFLGCQKSLYDGFQFHIYNRWGGKVFETFDLDRPEWRAFEAKEDTYVYTLSLSNELCGATYTYQGDILLLR